MILPQIRRNNASNETIRIKNICDNINNRTPMGLNMCNDYFKIFNKEIDRVEQRGGRRYHYDMDIYHTDGTNSRCEEKGTHTIKNLNISVKPWEHSVQIYNGTGRKFTICNQYANLWYDSIVSDIRISEKYNINPQLIPNRLDWLNKDAFQSGSPRSEWGKLLKINHRRMYPGTSMTGDGDTIDYRPIVKQKMIFNQQDKEILKNESQETINNFFSDKDCYLQTSGILDNDTFSWRWWNSIEPPQINDIIMCTNGTDIDFNYITNSINLTSKLRWGNGIGFANIRFDIK